MYNQFFGFRERPFKLAPDPDYLFLSKSHEEALAYLKYAVTEDEGFVEIIGEVGAGKTMLCRAFLENLGEDTESAYIFNPKMNAVELLKAINDEFDIPSGFNETKSLIDALNVFLMDRKSQGKKAILIIDEAQNLSKEVLEQIRLLSNLETTKNKLLQIILVGQPELGDLLDSYDLRQLSQRISLCCRLNPLRFSETVEYIHHRVYVASKKPAEIFTRSAIRRIYKYSRGIPRLINIACDRALLTAYGFNSNKVTASIASAAIRELISRGENKHIAAGVRVKRLASMVLLAVILGFIWIYQSDFKNLIYGSAKPFNMNTQKIHEKDRINHLPKTGLKNRQDLSLALPADKKPPESNMLPSGPSSEHQIEQASLALILASESNEISRTASLKTLLKHWGADQQIPQELNNTNNYKEYLTLVANRQGLILEEINSDLARIRNLNLCAILEFKSPETQAPVYLAAVEANHHSMIFVDGQTDRRVKIGDDDIDKYWTGRAFVFWKNFYNYQGIIPLNTQGMSVVTLKFHLRDIGFTDVEINSAYDSATRSAIKTLQASHGIAVDGYVGPLTKIVLYNETPSLPIPRLANLEFNH
jgi:general secretion pathway protein A